MALRSVSSPDNSDKQQNSPKTEMNRGSVLSAGVRIRHFSFIGVCKKKKKENQRLSSNFIASVGPKISRFKLKSNTLLLTDLGLLCDKRTKKLANVGQRRRRSGFKKVQNKASGCLKLSQNTFL